MASRSKYEPPVVERTLVQIVEELAAHDQQYPHHGVNCACMDQYVRDVRLLTQVPQSRQAQRRVDYVLLAAMQSRRFNPRED